MVSFSSLWFLFTLYPLCPVRVEIPRFSLPFVEIIPTTRTRRGVGFDIGTGYRAMVCSKR